MISRGYCVGGARILRLISAVSCPNIFRIVYEVVVSVVITYSLQSFCPHYSEALNYVSIL